ncbi:MAG: hydrogenase subunit MbhD domain-containing protein [Gammaproteobacteria bacterium]|nr:hydrogenase subunit MbhD domain-containing protein [Gammaproteobacteria bacterium]
MINLFGIFMLTLLVITALAIVRTRNLFSAVMLTSIFSLLMAANFFILDAADVALTEAAVGAGVTTVSSFHPCAHRGAREAASVFPQCRTRCRGRDGDNRHLCHARQTGAG